MKKIYAISTDGSHPASLLAAWQSDHRTALRASWYQDSADGICWLVFKPRNLRELLTIQSMPGLTVLPDLEDQMTTLSPHHVAAMPSGALVTTEHNTYQAALRLFNHYQWHPFHPLER
jgi:hypothetical protein